MKLSLVVAAAVFMVLSACTKKEGPMLYYDWNTMGVKAPSVLPDVEYETVAFTVTSVKQVDTYISPPVLAPYNVRMDFNTHIEGVQDGKKTRIETHSDLLKGLKLSEGAQLIVKVGKSNQNHVYGIAKK